MRGWGWSCPRGSKRCAGYRPFYTTPSGPRNHPNRRFQLAQPPRAVKITEQRAKILAEAIGPNSDDEHIATLDYVHIFVRNLFNYNLLLTDELSSLPDRSQAVGKPYPTEAFANGATKRSILCCNFQEPAELEKELAL